MSTAEYTILWLTYLIGVSFFISLLSYVTKNLKNNSRKILLITTTSLLCIPWFTKNQMNYLSPAIFTAIYDIITGEWVDFYRAGITSITGTILIVVVTMLLLPKTNN